MRMMQMYDQWNILLKFDLLQLILHTARNAKLRFDKDHWNNAIFANSRSIYRSFR